MERSEPKLTYAPGLDGVRGVSIIGIMANHGGVGWAAGGFISVNVFFVLSGFLITSLLIKEWRSRGSIKLSAFWARRARRLLPALFVLLAGIALYAWTLAPVDTRGSLRGDGLATLFYFANWHEILAGQSYFAQTGAVSPLLHTWTLAIEEQFYLCWPLVVLAILRWRRSLRPLTVLAVILTVLSALEMALLFHPGSDPSRLYYGTDTRAQDLLTGASLALLLATLPSPIDGRRSARRTAVAAALVAAAGFAFEWAQLDANSSLPYRGGFLMADLFSAIVILGIVEAPGGLVDRVLGFRSLAYVGKISYALYLWHWPVFVVLDHERTGLAGTGLLAARVAASFVPAVISSHLVEMPIRRGALKRWRAWVAGPVAALSSAGVLLAATAIPAGVAPLTLSSLRAGASSEQASQSSSDIPALDSSDPALGPSVPFNLAALYGPDAAKLAPVLFVGDSVSLTLFMGIYRQAAAAGLEIIPRGVVGCGLSVALPLVDQGVIGDPFPDCPNWPSWWAHDVAYYRPKLVCLITGYWETMDRFYEGRFQHLGDPAFDAYVTAQLWKAIRILSSTGAKVAVFTSPYFENGEQPDGQLWPEANPERVDDYNRIVRKVAAQDPSVVSVVDFGAYLDPKGHFTSTIDGITVRAGDGVHTTLAGDALVAPKIIPQLVSLVRQQETTSTR
jgi:peptidoglycan/LPS O-acetylase OafA/YrhL